MSKKVAALLQKQLDELVFFLNQEQIKFALLGSPTGERILATDLDLCTEDIGAFDSALRKFCSYDERLLITKRYHATGIRYNFSFRHDLDSFIFPGPDVLIFPTWHIKGYIGLSYADLLKNCNKAEDACYHPSVTDAFLFYLIKRIDKGKLSEEQGTYLNKLWSQNPVAIQTKLKDFFSGANVALITTAATSGCWNNVMAQLPELTADLIGLENFSFSRWIWIFQRIVYRFFSTTGFFVVFLGPDGSGKSSVIAKVSSELVPPFTNTSYTHLRPRLALKTNQYTIVTDPHNKPPRGLCGSISKLFYFLLDYGVGYLLKIKPLLVKSTLVIFDRYYFDLLIDPMRYRYGGPLQFAKFVGWFIPKPDLVILLDAPTEVLQIRKQEVSFEETARQRQAYLEFVTGLKNGIVIDSSQPLEQVIQNTKSAILNSLAQRVRKCS